MDEEILRYTAFLQECVKSIPGCVVTNKYTGRDTPYRWEFQLGDPLVCLGSLSLNGQDILQMQLMSEADQRSILCSKSYEILRGFPIPSTE